MSVPEVAVIDYHKTSAADALLPNPAMLSSSSWTHLQLEVFQQPKFEIAEHQHTMHVIALGLSDGSIGERWLDGKCRSEHRSSHDIAVIPAGILHRCNWNDSTQFEILAVEPALLKQVGQDWIDGDRIELIPQFMNRQDALIQGVFSTLKAEIKSGGMGSDLLIDSLRTSLAIHLLRHYCSTQPKPFDHSSGLSQLALEQIKEYIQEHLHQNLKIVDLSAIAQMSSFYFQRLFKQKMGVTPHQYILQQRIEKAQHLLKQGDLSIAEIALKVGFCDQSHLTRCFKRRIGVTPKQLLHDRFGSDRN